MARRPAKSKTTVKVNFKGVESRRTPPEGDYICQVLEAKAGTSQGGNDQIEFICEVAKGEYKGTKLYFYCPLAENSLWKLHAFLTVLGEEVPEDEMDIDLSDLAEREFVGVLTHETYQGKKRAKLTDFDSVDNYKGDDAGDDDDEDEDDKKSKSKGGRGKKSKDDDDDDDKKSSKGKSKKDEAPDYDDMDEDELRDLYIERELGTKREAKKLDEDELREALEDADKAAAKKSKSKKDDDDEDDEPKGKKGKSKKAKKVAKSDVEDMDEDELQELIDEHDLDVDLDDHKKLSKKIAAVIEGLDDKDLLEDDDD